MTWFRTRGALLFLIAVTVVVAALCMRPAAACVSEQYAVLVRGPYAQVRDRAGYAALDLCADHNWQVSTGIQTQ